MTADAARRPLSDSFLTGVAVAYEEAVALRVPPGKAIAAANGVELRTAQNWIYKARKRGIIPPVSGERYVARVLDDVSGRPELAAALLRALMRIV